mgnify:CR=1 FL=1
MRHKLLVCGWRFGLGVRILSIVFGKLLRRQPLLPALVQEHAQFVTELVSLRVDGVQKSIHSIHLLAQVHHIGIVDFLPILILANLCSSKLLVKLVDALRQDFSRAVVRKELRNQIFRRLLHFVSQRKDAAKRYSKIHTATAI